MADPKDYQAGEGQTFQGELVPAEMRNLAVLCHITGVIAIIGPLIMWLLLKDRHKFVDVCGKEAVNYQISLLIYMSIAGLLCIILIGILLLWALMVTNLVLVITAALKASKGEVYRYPIAFRLIS